MSDLSVALLCIFCFFAGIHFGVHIAVSNRSRIRNEKEQEQEANDVTKRGIYVEEHQNKLFAYDIKTHQFLCSFTTFKDLHNSLMAIDSNSSWVFYEDSRVVIEGYMRRNNGANNPL